MLISDVSRLLFREECLHLGSMVMINDQLGGKRVRFDGNPVGDESLQKKIPACPSCSPAHTPTQKIKAWTQTIKHTNLTKALIDVKVSISRRQLYSGKLQQLSVVFFHQIKSLP